MKIYCSGIGGIGLSAYAALQNASGHTVMGSDRAGSALIEDLRSQGMTVFLEQDGSHLPKDLDLFVYSEAIPKDAPERRRASDLGVRQLSYFGALGELSKDFRVIAVCGTHGKSSTVAMAARVLMHAGLDPSVVVGTKLLELQGRNWHRGESDLFLLEETDELDGGEGDGEADLLLDVAESGGSHDSVRLIASNTEALLRVGPQEGFCTEIGCLSEFSRTGNLSSC